MKISKWLRVEGAAIFISFLCGALVLNPSQWYILVFFLPDLSFIAYVKGPKIGAIVYNICHSYAIPMLTLSGILCFGTNSDVSGNLMLFAMVWVAHIGFDRMMGYGLKEVTSFQDTHLGRIGKIKDAKSNNAKI